MKQNKTNNKKTTYATFPLKKSRAIVLLSAGALALSLAGIALSSYRLYQSGVHSFYDCLKYPFLIAVCLFAIAVVLGLFIRSEYRVSKTELIVCYGFIKSRLPLSQISAVTSDTDSDKIYVTLPDTEGQMVIDTAPDKREDFVRALLQGNPSIDYGFTLREKKDEEK
ncbi:MAG: hypothetical protein SPH68_06640 [Candidatus Borkfalkiaceae bacterium]|nr:hypothetical protein [Clostridia bacterium]MDY6223815.1 hypothetical protein [Christensenellaceae bacterium]